MHLVWQDAYPPAICVRILDIRGSNNQFLDYCLLMCVPNNFNSFKSVWPPKILVYGIGISQILIWKKYAISQNWESIKNNSFWVIFIKKYVKIVQTVLKRALLNHRRQKVNRTDPSWNLKILGATVTKNFEILKIAGSRAEFLNFDFEI